MIEWFVRDEPYRDAVDLLLREKSDGHVRIGRAEITLEPHEPGMMISEPTLTLSRPEAQQLINGLWQAGFRPRDGSGAVAHVEAMERHLKDMRHLAFKGNPPQ